MAPRLPKRIDAEIYDRLNESINSGIAIPELQLHGLIRKAEKLQASHKYACLAAIYSHALDYERTVENVENAINSLGYGSDEQDCVDNILSALTNNMLFSDVLYLSKKFPILLNYKSWQKESYNAALCNFDLYHCERIVSDFGLLDGEETKNYEEYWCYLDNDTQLVNKANEYMAHVLGGLTALVRKNNLRIESFNFHLAFDGFEDYIEVIVSLLNTSMDKAIDLEFEWHAHIAKFYVSEAQLCNMAFSIEGA
ncbi:hypothetical protein [Salinivibrio sp. YCSC6]|uniref:hypothetical protein n=1 Tax=Salinivibrio sp. YCSC6 TaxID=2003370 RepID=UPI000BBBE4F8|nr:hypothetical protein [Salinivibrio sp. YCSC6]PCE67554.1 hypothetical protein B6G00_04190 [Salinivibrio sp. YCSC6]QCF35539.1 hypothetical protein E8E00_04760 [Salinivibrio sp. YCSC6]